MYGTYIYIYIYICIFIYIYIYICSDIDILCVWKCGRAPSKIQTETGTRKLRSHGAISPWALPRPQASASVFRGPFIFGTKVDFFLEGDPEDPEASLGDADFLRGNMATWQDLRGKGWAKAEC